MQISNKKILRIFPRRTNATPDDPMVLIGHKPLFIPDCDEVHVSVTFSWDLSEAMAIADEYRLTGYNVKVGGPATGMKGENFISGMYLKRGHVITSRGCPNQCWFCDVWKRDGSIRELPITEGWIIQDDNLLACSATHVLSVFDMLKLQPKKARFIGGIEAKRFDYYWADEFQKLKPESIFFAYDEPDDYEPLRCASKLLNERGIGIETRQARCYVLCGYPKDTIESAEKRMEQVLDLDILPFAMLYRDKKGKYDISWRRFARHWARLPIIMTTYNTRREEVKRECLT